VDSDNYASDSSRSAKGRKHGAKGGASHRRLKLGASFKKKTTRIKLESSLAQRFAAALKAKISMMAGAELQRRKEKDEQSKSARSKPPEQITNLELQSEPKQTSQEDENVR